MKEKELKKTRVANPVRNPELLETIRVEDGTFRHLDYHNARFNYSRKHVLGIAEPFDLAGAIQLPGFVQTGLYKCRITYGLEISKVEFLPYVFKQIRTLRLVICDTILYPYKFADRREIETLYAQREKCDDILIVRKGKITDTSYANVAFWDGSQWLTPQDPLLPGTTRARLLDQGAIQKAEIKIKELAVYKKIRIFNAMVDEELPVSINTLVFP